MGNVSEVSVLKSDSIYIKYRDTKNAFHAKRIRYWL